VSMAGPMVIALAGAMALTAAFCAGRLALAPWRRGRSEPAIDGLHLVMAVAMVAMLLGLLRPRADTVLVLGFVGGALWFVRAAVIRGSWHALQHGAGCLAMLAMLIAQPTSYAASGPQVLRGMSSMPGMGTASGALAPYWLFAGFVGAVAVAVIALAAVDTAQVGRGGVVALTGGRPVLAPRCAAGCRIAMGLTMGIALLAML
jgi:hypothetical protein